MPNIIPVAMRTFIRHPYWQHSLVVIVVQMHRFFPDESLLKVQHHA
jgi:hypothetical protein